MPLPHPPEFRRRAVELARQVDDDGQRLRPVKDLALELGISESAAKVRLHRARRKLKDRLFPARAGGEAEGATRGSL